MKKYFLFAAIAVLFCTAFAQHAQAQIGKDAFVTVWKPDFNTIMFPGIGSNYTIDVYDSAGATLLETLTGNGTTIISNLTAGDFYTIAITPGSGSFTGFGMTPDSLDLLQVAQWGSIVWFSLNFTNCDRLSITAKDVPNVSGIPDLSNVFFGNSIDTIPFINDWNVSNATNMSSMFAHATGFNQPLNKWNTSNVTNMSNMFSHATAFNQSLGNWNLSGGSAVSGPGVRKLNGAGGTPDLTGMLDYSGLDCNNYSETLIGWAAGLGTTTPTDVTLGAATLQYGAYAVAARNALIAAGWTITDGGEGGCMPLPITLQSFTAQAQNNNTTLLKWTTATEINNKGFEIQRSAEGAVWQDMAFVNSNAANGNSSIPLSYQYIDRKPLLGYNYYRLAQTDLNGGVIYSDVRTVQFNSLINVYPNPVKSILTITGISSKADYKLINASGATVLKGTFSPSDKNYLSVEGLASGIYFLHIITNGVTNTYKIGVQE